jgi:HlyD family type I secretion membrane fusion protein
MRNAAASFPCRGDEFSSVPEKPPVRRAVLAGVALMAVGVGGFSAWATIAPLSSAAISPGIIRVDSNRKTVQHLEGGIIAELLVREGDRVVAGQVMLRLDDLVSRSLRGMLEGQYLALRAQETRLIAERDGLNLLTFPPELEGTRGRAEVVEILAGQERIFDSGRALVAGQVDVLRQRIAQLQAQIDALEAQLAAGEEQMALIREEVASVEELVAKGLERKPRLLALERNVAYLTGVQGDFRGRIAQAREAIAEAELQILNLQRARVDKAAAELRDVQTRRAEIQERYRAADVHLVRREVLAPQAGRVLKLRYFAPGGVIPPGGEILDIVPEDDRLIVEARVSPTDIDVVHEGLSARVVLPAYKSRVTPQVKGEVTRVSADVLADERSGEPYYLARIEIDELELARIDRVRLYPGMPAEAFIVTGERTVLEYLIQPVTESFRRAFREE